MASKYEMYGGRDPRELPAYGVTQAAWYLRIPPATLRSWVRGRTYPTQGGFGSFAPLIQPADGDGRRLSFVNLVEAHVLRALRTEHGVPLKAVRPAIAYAEQQLGLGHLLLSKELLTDGGQLFLDHYGSLINLTRSGQIAMRKVLERHLRRVDWDSSAIPIRLFPFLQAASETQERPVVIDPTVSFGRPTLAGSGIQTSVVVARIDSGEGIEDVARDYELSPEQIEEALIFERAA